MTRKEVPMDRRSNNTGLELNRMEGQAEDENLLKITVAMVVHAY